MMKEPEPRDVSGVMHRLSFEPWLEQQPHWPSRGRHILAQADADTVVVYQAYKPSIAAAAVADQRFGGGGFSFTRMSWLKTNFLWMMHRSSWATAVDQERVLALWVPRRLFVDWLRAAVASSFDRRRYETEAAWRAALATSSVRLQWDPDHGPTGAPAERRAVQIGLRGDALKAFGDGSLVAIDDVTDFVAEQREHRADRPRLITPHERVLDVDDDTAARIGLDV